ncbi:phosphotriesterase [Lachnospiraceae bacterium WCA-9-b2]|jgi:phosphotriesterase-related protein|uniref:Phosphotriesterase n=1 Tax=Sporofaciens musculi TaxID=2681861 RepID=A0A7X3SLI6_9FIRM|nr:phosphotriesterase [Sporofaciens musculi]MXP78460.1 phosphotriesterase [Sporofaciens musculi]
MKIIRTVLGDISNKEMGVTDCHDHIIRSGGPEVRDGSFLMDDVNAAKKEFGNFLSAGGRTMVCMDPIGCGRNVGKMLEVAKAYRDSGNIVMTTGFQKGSNYCPNTSFLATVDVKKIAEMMILEIVEGMDIHSYNGPVVERTTAKAGVIKAGASYRLITRLEQKALEVAAITQKETGCPISIHTDFGTMGIEIIELLKGYGANPEKVILCHMQRNLDQYYYEEILSAGAVICFDEPNKPQYRPDIVIAENIQRLIERGFGGQLVLGMDGGKREALGAYMEPEGLANGLEYLLTRFVPVLEKSGISKGDIRRMLVDNPAEVFSINI